MLLHGLIGQQIYNLPAHTARHLAAIRRVFSMIFSDRGPTVRVQMHVEPGQQISAQTLQRMARVGAQFAMQDPNILFQVLDGRDPVFHFHVQRVDQEVRQQQNPVPQDARHQHQANQSSRPKLKRT